MIKKFSFKSAVLILGVFLATSTKSLAVTLYSAGSGGNWTTVGTWTFNSNGTGNCSCIPTGGDIINILAGDVVTVTTNENVGAAAVTINVNGELNITGFLDLLSSSSIVNIYPGGMLTSNGSASSKIRVGGTASAEYTGADGDKSGPWTISNGFSGVNAALPVILISFKGTSNNSTTTLTWKTSEEINNNHFEIQKSLDGIYFNTIGTVAANSSYSYSFVDTESFTGKAYYRLKQVDVDNRFEYSTILIVNNEPSEAFDLRIFPNPASGNDFTLLFSGTSSNIVLVVFDIHGQELFSKVMATESNNVLIGKDLEAKLKPGIYYIQASSEHKLTNKKLIIE